MAGKKIAFISDLHAQKFGPREEEVIAILRRENPDLTFLGGDYISFKGSYEPVSLFLGQVRNAYAVLGNTEYTNENGSCILCHHEKSRAPQRQPNVHFLRNSGTTLNIDGKKNNLVGLDGSNKERCDLKAELKKRNNSAPTILLAHFPELFDEAVKAWVGLMLSGHNHGGQVFFARFLKGAVFVDPCFDYMEGFFQKGNTLMYVSRGVGNGILPFRLGVRPEVTFLEFVSGEASMGSFEKVSNKPAERVSVGFSIANLGDLFDFSNHFRKTYKTEHRIDQSGKLFNFESEAEFEYLDWECHK